MVLKTRNPLQPFSWVVSGLAALSVMALLAGVVMSAITHQASLWGIGETPICVQDDAISVGGASDDQAFVGIVRHGVAASNKGLSLCAQHPTTWQQTLNVLTQLPTGVFTLGLLILLWRLVAGAQRLGPFARVNPRRLRSLGWWLLIGDLIADNAQTLAHTALLRSMTTPAQAPLWTDNMPSFSWTMLIVGLGMLTVARILTMATAMHEELAVTV
jgi:Protein of unknown function (DUF2975)